MARRGRPPRNPKGDVGPEKPETEQPEADKTPAPAQEIDNAAFHVFHNEITTAGNAQKTATANARNAFKNAEKAGVNLKIYKLVRDWLKLSEEEWAATKATILRYCGFLNLPIGTELSLALGGSEQEEPTDFVDKAYREGKQVGLAGGNMKDCPHTAATASGQAWLRGYGDGQRELATATFKAPAASSAAPHAVS